MPDIASLGPILATPKYTYSEGELQAVITGQHQANLGEQIDAVAGDQFGAVLGRFMGRMAIPSDPSWQLTPEGLGKLTEGLDQPYWKQFIGVNSEAEAQTVRAQMLELQDRKQALASTGMTGTMLSMAGSLTDPANVAVMLATGGASAAVTTTSRLANMARFGLIESSAMASMGQVRASQDPTRTGWDTAAESAAGLGGGFTTGIIKPGVGAFGRFMTGVTMGAATSAPVETARQVMDADREGRDFIATVGLASLFGGFQGLMTSPAHKAAATGEIFDAVDGAVNTSPDRVSVRRVYTVHGDQTLKTGPGTDHLYNYVSSTGQVVDAEGLTSSFINIDLDKWATGEALARWRAAAGPDAGVPRDVRLARTIAQWMPQAEGAKFVSDAEAAHGAVPQDALDRVKKVEEAKTAAAAQNPPINGMGAASPSTMTLAPFPKDPTHGLVAGQWDFSADNITDAFSWGTTGIRANIQGVKFHLGTSRFNMGAMVAQSPFSEFRFIANALAPDYLAKSWTPNKWYNPFSNQTLAPNNLTVPEWKQARLTDHLVKMENANVPAFGNYKENGGTLDYNGFMEAAADTISSGVPSQVPEINAAAQAAQKNFKELLEMQQRHGVAGSETIPTDPKYVPRVGDEIKIHAKIQQLTRDGVVDGLRQAIQSKQPHLSDTDAAFRADRWLDHQLADKTLGSHERGQFITLEKEGDLRASVEAFMRRSGTGINPVEVDRIVQSVTRDAKVPSFNNLKMRLDMDETSTFATKTGDFKVTDLLERNLELLEQNYANAAFAHSGLAEVFRAFSNKYGMGQAPVKVESIDGLMQELTRVAEGFKQLDPNYNYAVDLNKIETLLKQTAGIGRESMLGKMVSRIGGSDAAVRSAANDLTNVMFIRSMGHVQSGAQNLTDLVYAASEGGARAAMKSLPEMVDAINSIRTGGPAATAPLRLLQAIGAGNDVIVQNMHARSGVSIADDATYQYQRNQLKQRKVSNWLAQGSRRAFLVSGQTHGTAAMQKIIGTQIMQRFVDSARSGKLPNRSRLFAMGLEEPMAQRISAVLNDPNVITLDRGSIADINESAWLAKDPESYSSFLSALNKEIFRISIAPHPQQFAMWMDDPLGRVLMQLRKWGAASYEGKGLGMLQNRDGRSARSFVSMAAVAAAWYAALKYKDSLTQEDPQAYRDKYLTPEKVFLVGATRAGYFGLLPTVADGVLNAHGEDAVFSQGRASAVTGGNILGGSPTADAMGKAWRFYNSSRRLAFSDDYNLSKYDVRNASQLLIPRFAGVSEALDFMINNSDLPDTSR